MVELARLESVYRRNPIKGSNPFPSAKENECPLTGAFVIPGSKASWLAKAYRNIKMEAPGAGTHFLLSSPFDSICVKSSLLLMDVIHNAINYSNIRLRVFSLASP